MNPIKNNAIFMEDTVFRVVSTHTRRPEIVPGVSADPITVERVRDRPAFVLISGLS